MTACTGPTTQNSLLSAPTDVSATVWASHVCSTVTAWINEIQAGGTELQSAEMKASSLPQAKSVLLSFLDEAVTSTNNLVSGVRSTGAPAVTHGQAIDGGLMRSLQGAQTTFFQVRTQAQQLPVEDRTAFVSQAQALGNSLDNTGTQVESNLNAISKKYASAELDAAFKNQAACQPLNGNGQAWQPRSP